ncbi:hypothetical protein O1611_g5998 [Lasiodiplodia mahajangana]|uniref:Uncharacterized protein n=1 Tax=Lasiodiplodia mahajangana TaxID=1108764 RepID=A0ACC2JJB6_9PEZI|nr:hypothetical protein O1611_g5998 [Lasiodiplodia mahajangana]
MAPPRINRKTYAEQKGNKPMRVDERPKRISRIFDRRVSKSILRRPSSKNNDSYLIQADMALKEFNIEV